MKRTHLILLSIMTWVVGPAAAESFRDPTRPPEAFAAPLAEGGEAAAPTLRLEAVLRGKEGAVAVIAGERLRVGDAIRGVRVLAIRESEVVLSGEEGQRELLRLTPAVEKKMVPARERPAGRGNTGGRS